MNFSCPGPDHIVPSMCFAKRTGAAEDSEALPTQLLCVPPGGAASLSRAAWGASNVQLKPLPAPLLHRGPRAALMLALGDAPTGQPAAGARSLSPAEGHARLPGDLPNACAAAAARDFVRVHPAAAEACDIPPVIAKEIDVLGPDPKAARPARSSVLLAAAVAMSCLALCPRDAPVRAGGDDAPVAAAAERALEAAPHGRQVHGPAVVRRQRAINVEDAKAAPSCRHCCGLPIEWRIPSAVRGFCEEAGICSAQSRLGNSRWQQACKHQAEAWHARCRHERTYAAELVVR